MAASGITYAGKAIESINIPNQVAYLSNLIKSGTAGQKLWAKGDLSLLNKAADAYNTVIKNASSKTVPAAAAIVTETVNPTTPLPEVDPTTIVGYDPSDYTSSSASGSTISGSTIFGYLVVGLVGIVILDRLMK